MSDLPKVMEVPEVKYLLFCFIIIIHPPEIDCFRFLDPEWGKNLLDIQVTDSQTSPFWELSIFFVLFF